MPTGNFTVTPADLDTAAKRVFDQLLMSIDELEMEAGGNNDRILTVSRTVNHLSRAFVALKYRRSE